MKNGWVINCPKCGVEIDDFTHADEWFCDCGESGTFEREDGFDDDWEDDDELQP